MGFFSDGEFSRRLSKKFLLAYDPEPSLATVTFSRNSGGSDVITQQTSSHRMKEAESFFLSGSQINDAKSVVMALQERERETERERERKKQLVCLAFFLNRLHFRPCRHVRHEQFHPR